MFRVMLHAYPPSFRQEYGREMALLFEERAQDLGRSVWPWVLRDLVMSAPRLRWEEGAMRTSIVAAVAAIGLSVASAIIFMGTRDPGQMALASVVILTGIAIVTLIPLALGRRLSRPTEGIYREGGKAGFVWWLVPAVGLGLAQVFAIVKQLVEDPKPENVFALGLFVAFSSCLAAGIMLRAQGKPVGRVLIIIGVVPCAAVFWSPIPPLVVLAVVVAVLMETGAASRARVRAG